MAGAPSLGVPCPCPHLGRRLLTHWKAGRLWGSPGACALCQGGTIVPPAPGPGVPVAPSLAHCDHSASSWADTEKRWCQGHRHLQLQHGISSVSGGVRHLQAQTCDTLGGFCRLPVQMEAASGGGGAWSPQDGAGLAMPGVRFPVGPELCYCHVPGSPAILWARGVLVPGGAQGPEWDAADRAWARMFWRAGRTAAALRGTGQRLHLRRPRVSRVVSGRSLCPPGLLRVLWSSV